jgi:hypothetical protein
MYIYICVIFLILSTENVVVPSEVTGSVPGVTGSVHEVTGSIPGVKGSAPEVTGSVPEVTGSVPGLAESISDDNTIPCTEQFIPIQNSNIPETETVIIINLWIYMCMHILIIFRNL